MSSLIPAPVLCNVLVSSRSLDGGCDASHDAVIQVERLAFRSLDEEGLIQAQLEERQRQQERDRWIGRAIGAGLGLFLGGMVDGFEGFDAGSGITTAFVTGVFGGVAADGLSQISDQELRDNGFSWATEPDSFLFHRRRHGRPVARVLVIDCGEDHLPTTYHGVRFSDGYIAFFQPRVLEFDQPQFAGVRRLSGAGVMPDPMNPAVALEPWPCSDGRQRPLELLDTDAGSLLVMALPIPHHSLY
jgi:hypothetical protein